MSLLLKNAYSWIRRSMVATILLVCAFRALGHCQAISPADVWQNRQTGEFGDQGDGTYRNPILAMDYSDPDVIRVNHDYYMVSSTFESAPGIVVLHSRDLLNWETIGAAFSDMVQLGENFSWQKMANYKNGLYAPAIRFHAGKFYVFASGFNGEGFFVSSTTNPSGPWKSTQIRDRNGHPLRITRWTDPCPFWDEDGKAYLLTSHPRGDWYGHIFQMSPDGTQLLDADTDWMNGDGRMHAWPNDGTVYSPFHGTEGNKIYKRDGWYYLVHIEFLSTGHGKGSYILRSRNLYGTHADGTAGMPGSPGNYELLKIGLGVPGQGAFVDTPDGRWFWIGQGPTDGPEGRTPNMLPVSWEDNWPIPGVRGQNGERTMAWHLPSPLPLSHVRLPEGTDSFSSTHLNPQWAWNHQPCADRWSLTERRGYLRLHAFPPAKPGFWGAANTLSVRSIRSENTVMMVEFDICSMVDGQQAGVAHFNGGTHYALAEIRQMTGRRMLIYDEDGAIVPGPELPVNTCRIWLRSQYGFDAVNHYSYSLDGVHFRPFGGSYLLKPGNWRGDRFGIFNFNVSADTGYLDVNQYSAQVLSRPAKP